MTPPGPDMIPADSPPLVLVAAVALIDARDRVLLAQRPAGKKMAGLWEFPGGKVEPGETPEQALARELAEEIAVAVEGTAFQPLTFASHAYDHFHLLMPLYLCRQWRGVPEGREGQALRWVPVRQLADWAMPPADGPLVAALARLI